nr:glycoside hydrolase family 2 protein [Lachnospiraceae bacterium]
IILWGVRINESPDDDAFYKRTNEMAHALDPSRPTGGVRNIKKSHLYEDVYTYNDFVHDGKKHGVDKKSRVTSDMDKPYLVSEYNGHMFPTKAFDWEEKRAEHAMRHVRVLDAVAAERDICGSFGWCMFDYNTHKDFGSGDRICYHGVTDMFRNAKLAAAPYAAARKEIFLEISSSMDIGEHPGCNRGETYIFTNADSVKMYKNDRFIKEYFAKDTPYKHMVHGPLVIDDYIGDALDEEEDLSPDTRKLLKDAFNTVARTGVSNIPPSVALTAARCVALHGLKPQHGIDLYTKYIGDWGGESTVYKFEAYKDGKLVKTVIKEPMHSLHLNATADHTLLKEGSTYDCALIRIRMEDENGNTLSFCNDPIQIKATGDIELIGPELVALQGGMYGAYVKTIGKEGAGTLTISAEGAEPATIAFITREV